jgi:endonuclease/exonuclease/phosphatase family metal-dependent hydrolase
MLQPQEYKLDENPIIFKGNEGTWHVGASITTTNVLETQPPPANCVSKHPLLTNRLYLPAVFQTGFGNFPDPTPPTTTKLQTIQYNVQFLTPWDEGEIPGHWPNTSERATAIGEALACFDMVALNETVNDTRRAQIIGTMQAKAPFCPNFLSGDLSLIPDSTSQIQQKDELAEQGDEISGQSFFNFVDGPDLTYTPVITGWPSGLRAINENRGEPLADDELTIVSRFPIVETNSYIYKNSYGIDGLAAKGVLHARIRVGEPEASTYVDVFATHLQAGHDDYKRCQVIELADFIYETADPVNPVLLLGDFNIDGSTEARAEPASNYNYLMNILKNLSSGHNIQDTGLHLTSGTDHSDNPEENRKKRIDHIFVSQNLTWSQDNVQIVDFAGIEEKPTLSDHAAVTAILELPKEDDIEVDGTDLTIKGLVATSNEVTITIKNVGNTFTT